MKHMAEAEVDAGFVEVGRGQRWRPRVTTIISEAQPIDGFSSFSPKHSRSIVTSLLAIYPFRYLNICFFRQLQNKLGSSHNEREFQRRVLKDDLARDLGE